MYKNRQKQFKEEISEVRLNLPEGEMVTLVQDRWIEQNRNLQNQTYLSMCRNLANNGISD